MAIKAIRLTALLVEAICTRLKAGGTERVAVESAGVPWQLYQAWLDRASKPRSGLLYSRLAAEVVQAQASARLRAEMEVRDKDPKAWLLHGPGRETATYPGWGPAAKASANAQTTYSDKILFELSAVMLAALTPFPEARGPVAEALQAFFHNHDKRP